MEYFKHKLRSKSPFEIAFTVAFIIVAICGFAALFGFVVMWLWNAVIPDVFGLPVVTYWQAVGILILAKLFFGGFGGDHKSSKRKKKHDWEYKKEDKFFSKWELYDQFWKEEGKAAYEDYVKRNNNQNIENETTETNSEDE